jgi:hypothetical protein
MLSSSSFSQTVTDKICFSHDKARAIAIDLTRGDSAIAELKIMNKMVWQLNEKINAKDSTINIYIAKEVNYIKQVADYEKMVTVQDTIIKGLENDVNDLTRKNTNLKRGVKWLGGGFLASVFIILTFTIIK